MKAYYYTTQDYNGMIITDAEYDKILRRFQIKILTNKRFLKKIEEVEE